MSKEKCPNCGNEEFAILRDMKGTRKCKCGHSWLPAPKAAKRFTKEEANNIYICLGMRRNLIETGDSSLSAQSAVDIGKPEKMKVLTTAQMQLIIDIDKLMKECLECM